jgi:hypothetical protein
LRFVIRWQKRTERRNMGVVIPSRNSSHALFGTGIACLELRRHIGFESCSELLRQPFTESNELSRGLKPRSNKKFAGNRTPNAACKRWTTRKYRVGERSHDRVEETLIW